MASKKPVKKHLKKETAKKAAKKDAKPAQAQKAVRPSKNPRHSKLEDEELEEVAIPDVAEGEEAPDEAELSKDSDADEREASRLDLEEVAKQADRFENRQPSDGDVADGVSKEDQLALEGVVPPARPTTANSDEYDPESVDAMADFKARSVLGAEERNAVIQEVKQAAEKNGGYVTYEQLNAIVPQTVQDDLRNVLFTAFERAAGDGMHQEKGDGDQKKDRDHRGNDSFDKILSHRLSSFVESSQTHTLLL